MYHVYGKISQAATPATCGLWILPGFFGRAIVEQILKQAAKKTDEDGADATTVNMNF